MPTQEESNNYRNPQLSVLIGPEPGRRLTISKPRIIIGRGISSDIRFNDRAMSRTHCEILKNEDNLIIRDLESQNGIRVNGRDVTEQILQDGDQLDIGSMRFIVIIPEPE